MAIVFSFTTQHFTGNNSNCTKFVCNPAINFVKNFRIKISAMIMSNTASLASSFNSPVNITRSEGRQRLLPPGGYNFVVTPGRMVQRRLPLWYEDERAIYVHAGLEGEGRVWFHPTKSQEMALLWMREDDFWTGYSGKRLVFGHTVTSYLPLDHLNWIEKVFDDKGDVWIRSDLIGIDTGCGKGGFLSAVELPGLKVYESR
jgi:hypothetical protein